MNMELKQIQSKADDIKKEIIQRIGCEIEDFEIVEFERSGIMIYWFAIYRGRSFYDIIIPPDWEISSINWFTKRLHISAPLKCFSLFK